MTTPSRFPRTLRECSRDCESNHTLRFARTLPPGPEFDPQTDWRDVVVFMAAVIGLLVLITWPILGM